MKLRARVSVLSITMRGRDVEFIFPADFNRPMIIVDEATRQVLRWKLTPDEQRTLDDFVTENYQPGGIEQ